MRKTIEILLLVLTVLLFITAFVSCKRNEDRLHTIAAAQLAKGFACTAQVSVGGRSYTVNIAKKDSDDCTLSFQKPAELSPLSFQLGKNGMTIQYGVLKSTVDPTSIPETSILNAVLDAFDDAVSKGSVHSSFDGKEIYISGTTQAGAFTLTLSRDFTPKLLKISAMNMEMRFNNFQYT